MVCGNTVVTCDILLSEKNTRYENLKTNSLRKHLRPKKEEVNLKYYIKCSFIICAGHLMLCSKLNVGGWDEVNILSVGAEESNACRIF